MNGGFVLRLLIISLMSGWLNTSFSQTYTFVHNSIARSYIVHLPTNYNSANIYPLVVNMHGLTNTAAIQESYTGMNAVSDTANFVLIYPDGISTSWNAGFNSPYNSGIDDVGFLNALLDTAIANYSIDTLRIYACGMSNGGYMSYRLACELEHRIAAIASVTGSMPDSMEYYCQNSRAVPVMQVHGTTDPTVNYNGGPGYWDIESTVAYWVQKNSCPSTPVITPVPNTSLIDLCTAEKFYYGPCDNSTEVVFYKITNGGHTWPGAIPVPPLGNTNQDFNASGEIWKFLRRHTLPLISTPVQPLDHSGGHKLEIWPNPSSGIIFIAGDIPNNSDISIIDLFGQVVQQKRFIGNANDQIHMDVSNLANGVYLLKITNAEQAFYDVFLKQ